MVDDQLNSIRRLLDRVILLSGRSRRDLEKTLGYGRTYLTQMLSGRIELKLRVVLEVLAELGLDPVVFLTQALDKGPDGPGSGIEGLLKSAEKLGFGREPAPPPAPLPTSRSELEAMVLGLVESALRDREPRPAERRTARTPAGKKPARGGAKR